MARPFKLPDLGEGIHEAEIQEVLVSVGDEIEEDQDILVVETDKAAVEVPSPYAGTVQDIRVEPGDRVSVGDVLVVFDGGKEETEAAARQEEEPEAKEEAPREAKASDEEVAEGTVEQVAVEGRPVPAAPSTRRLARELNVDLERVEPSGPEGRVLAEDVRAFAEQVPSEEREGEAAPEGEEAEIDRASEAPSGAAEVRPVIEPPPLPDFSRWGAVERVPLRSVRRAIAENMALAWSQIPHVSHHDEADITELEDLRQRYKEKLDVGSLTMTVFVMKAAVAALKDHPRFNASLDPQSEEIVLKRYYHMGVAVDTDRGLIVPVIRDVDCKSIADLAAELEELVGLTREGKVPLEDLRGGTFTLTNVGILGGTSFEPMINYPQVAILGMARARWKPVVRGEKEIVPRYILPLVVAFDHRMVDGADAARFMHKIVEVLENPGELMLLA